MSNEEIGEGNIVWGVAHREETGEGEQTNKQTAANFISDVYCTYVNDLSCTTIYYNTSTIARKQ